MAVVVADTLGAAHQQVQAFQEALAVVVRGVLVEVLEILRPQPLLKGIMVGQGLPRRLRLEVVEVVALQQQVEMDHLRPVGQVEMAPLRPFLALL